MKPRDATPEEIEAILGPKKFGPPDRANPPERYYVEEGEFNEEGKPYSTLVNCTGQEEPVYMVGYEDPWIGVPLEEIKESAIAGQFNNSLSVLAQIKRMSKS